MIIQSLLLFRH